MVRAGCRAARGSFCRCGFSRACSADYSSASSSQPTRLDALHSLATTPRSPSREHSLPSSRRCAGPSGWSMPRSPKCQGAAAKEWLAEREAELLPVGYFHLVFTLPGRIADIAYHNKAAIYGLLSPAAAEATLTIAADPKRLGAKIGITAVLHSWGSAMTHHPHVHMIVPGGGISLDGT